MARISVNRTIKMPNVGGGTLGDIARGVQANKEVEAAAAQREQDEIEAERRNAMFEQDLKMKKLQVQQLEQKDNSEQRAVERRARMRQNILTGGDDAGLDAAMEGATPAERRLIQLSMFENDPVKTQKLITDVGLSIKGRETDKQVSDLRLAYSVAEEGGVLDIAEAFENNPRLDPDSDEFSLGESQSYIASNTESHSTKELLVEDQHGSLKRVTAMFEAHPNIILTDDPKTDGKNRQRAVQIRNLLFRSPNVLDKQRLELEGELEAMYNPKAGAWVGKVQQRFAQEAKEKSDEETFQRAKGEGMSSLQAIARASSGKNPPESFAEFMQFTSETAGEGYSKQNKKERDAFAVGVAQVTARMNADYGSLSAQDLIERSGSDPAAAESVAYMAVIYRARVLAATGVLLGEDEYMDAFIEAMGMGEGDSSAQGSSEHSVMDDLPFNVKAPGPGASQDGME